MEKLSLTTIREKYLSFFETKGHLRLKSFSLVPQNDNSLLLINAGMAPLKRYFTGEQTPPRKRVTTCQKCVRTLDIENVGKTARHGTFFEMLGNFSFGDYFKEEAIPWAWEFLTKIMEIPEEKLYVSVYEEDDEAKNIWMKLGLAENKIFKMGKDDNFWEIGAGPCGPCSEIYFDRGEKYGCGKPGCTVGCECDRFIEIWNIVFTQFDGDGKGNYARLSHPNIDTGMGLERLACVMQDVGNLFEVDTIRNIMLKLCETANIDYKGTSGKNDVSLRVITDHIRTATFLISDGVLPSNEGKGYILRRVLRRAARHGKLLGINGTFLSELCETVINENCSAYPELSERSDFIKKTISVEENRFQQTLDSGLGILEKMIDDANNASIKVLSGENIFKLYDTFGFPVDLTRELTDEKNLLLDEKGFSDLMRNQRQKAREARASLRDFGWSDETAELIDKSLNTEFVGYDQFVCESEILAIIKDDELQSIINGGTATLVLSQTPFYSECGGQVGDTGIIQTKSGKFSVTNTKKIASGQIVHVGTVVDGEISLGAAHAEIDSCRRKAIMRNHSSIHLMQAALRKVLGTHVEQAGSYVDEKHARFDFTHFQALSKSEIRQVEDLVNDAILDGLPITTTEMSINDAKKTGAMALFGEKYGEIVRVVKMGDFSTELCGGTHLDNTSKAGLFKIISESSVASGVRRIEAITGSNLLQSIYFSDAILATVQGLLKATSVGDIANRAEAILSEIKVVKKSLETTNFTTALNQIVSALANAETINGIRLVKSTFINIPVEALRTASDSLIAKNSDVVSIFVTENDSKVLLVSGCGKAAIARGAHAGKILSAISPIVGGGGGGRPDSASSGGKDASKISEALAAANKVLASQIGE